MLQMIRQGSSGSVVTAAQAQLNLTPSGCASLVLDGLFGPLTRARVQEFQRNLRLSPDGIVGPVTWRALAELRSSTVAPGGSRCDNGNAIHQSKSALLAPAARAGAFNSLVPTGGGAALSSFTAPASITVGGVTLVPLVGSAHETTARGVYASSLHYDRIFLSSGQGLQNRAFTVAVPVPPLVMSSLPLGGYIQVLNVGTSPSRNTLIHELGHAWQSQHHTSATTYMANCVACQGAALAANQAIALLDSSVKGNSDFPENFPMSAYAYLPGSTFDSYGGEQIAQQIHKG